MNINTLVNYKYSLFTGDNINTTNLKIIKSKIYGNTHYVVDNNNNLILHISTSSVANASRELWRTLKDGLKPSENDLLMFNDDMDN